MNSPSASNERAKLLWNKKAIGEHRSRHSKGSCEYFSDIRNYRYGYETPFIPRLFQFNTLRGKTVLEVGVGNGIDAVEIAKSGASYYGIDIVEHHIELTKKNFQCNHLLPPILYLGDLLEIDIEKKFDVVYSFGVLHHIAHEEACLNKIRLLLGKGGRFCFAVYSKWSFFNAYLVLTWLTKNRMNSSLDGWRSHVSERSELDLPVTIKIRSKQRIVELLNRCGFTVERYYKRGFVQRYLPLVGILLKPDGATLNVLGALLGWYHIFICKKTCVDQLVARY